MTATLIGAFALWLLLSIAGGLIFYFETREKPRPIQPGPEEADLLLIEYQSRERRHAILHGEPRLLKFVDRAIEEAVKIRVAE